MANTTGTFTDAMLKMRRELPGWFMDCTVGSNYYALRLYYKTPNESTDVTVDGEIEDWSAAAHRLVDEQIERERG